MKTLISALTLSAATFLHGPALAQATSTWTSISHSTPGTPTVSEYVDLESNDSPSSGSLSWALAPHSVAASSTAGFGEIVATVRATAAGGGRVSHFINSVYVDYLTLSHPGLDGQAGQLQAAFYYENTFVTSAGDSGRVETTAQWYGYGGDGWAESQVYEVHNRGQQPADYRHAYISDASGDRDFELDYDDRYLTLTLNFIWGQPLRIGLGLVSSGGAAEDGAYELTHAAYWAGLLGVTAGGVLVGDYSLTSASGLDYSQSFIPQVPEPGSVLLFAGGLVALAIHHLGRRRVRAPGRSGLEHLLRAG